MRREGTYPSAKLAFALSLGALVPGGGILFSLPCLALAVAALRGVRNEADRVRERRLSAAAIALALAGLALSVLEAREFLLWKGNQAEAQRALITEDRLARIAAGLDRHLAIYGRYPESTSALALRAALSPAILPECPVRDGWDQEFLVDCGPRGFRVWSRGSPKGWGRPPAAPGGPP